MTQADPDRQPIGLVALLFAALFYSGSCILMVWLFLDFFNLGDLVK